MKIENCDRVRCLDPMVTVTWRATDWMAIANAVGHYYKLLEAFDYGGKHRSEAVKHIQMLEAVGERIREEVRQSNLKVQT
jgi:hypothetical protein